MKFDVNIPLKTFNLVHSDLRYKQYQHGGRSNFWGERNVIPFKATSWSSGKYVTFVKMSFFRKVENKIMVIGLSVLMW